MRNNTHEATPPISYDQDRTNYRNAMRSPAEKTLNQVLGRIPDSYKELKDLQILVPGSGDFPSYKSFLRIITTKIPKLKSIRFVLIDTEGKQLDLFYDKFFTEETKEIKKAKGNSTLEVTCEINSIKLTTFFKENKEFFHIIYYEHPPVSTFLQLFEPAARFLKIDLGSGAGAAEFSDTLPLIAKLVDKNAMVIATTHHFEEQKQMERLINYSFGITAQPTVHLKSLLFSPKKLVIPKEYSCAVSGILKKELLNMDESKITERSQQIKGSRHLLFFFVLLSVILYLANPRLTAPWLLTGLHLLLHTPRPEGLIIKILIATLQTALVLEPNLPQKITHSFRT